MRRAREWRTALVSASCAMPMISRSTRVAEARQLVDDEVDRRVGRALSQVGEPLERGRDVLAGPTLGRSAPTDRRASVRCVRARSTAVSTLAATARRQRAAALALRAPAAASGSRRIPAPGCRGCRARGGCAPRGSPCGAPRGDSRRSAGSGAAPAPPAARSLRSARRATTALSGSGSPGTRDRHPAEVAAAEDERRRDDRRRTHLAA